jgi:phosphoglycerate dehydrogenase-like enzyme
MCVEGKRVCLRSQHVPRSSPRTTGVVGLSEIGIQILKSAAASKWAVFLWTFFWVGPVGTLVVTSTSVEVRNYERRK